MSISMLSVRTVHGNRISITYKGEIRITNYERTLCCDRSRYGGIHGTTGVYVIRITKDFFTVSEDWCHRYWIFMPKYLAICNFMVTLRSKGKQVECFPEFYKQKK